MSGVSTVEHLVGDSRRILHAPDEHRAVAGRRRQQLPGGVKGQQRHGTLRMRDLSRVRHTAADIDQANLDKGGSVAFCGALASQELICVRGV